MRTFTFGIQGQSANTNVTRCLPARFTTEVSGEPVEFIQMGAYNDPIFDGKDHDGPDITIVVSLDSSKIVPLQIPQTTVLGKRVLQISRLNKAVYNRMLNNWFCNEKGFIPLNAVSSYHFLPVGDAQWVARSPNGARGRGIGLVPKDRSADWFRTQAAHAVSLGSVEAAENMGIKIEPDNYAVKSSGEEKAKLEVFGAVGESEYVPFITDITHELRLITDHTGAFALGCPRERVLKSNGMLMAVGSENKPDDCFKIFEGRATAWTGGPVANVPAEIVQLIERLPRIPHMPLHSFDLFVRADGTWGFFEACCEYGECGIPNGWSYQETKLYMASLAKELLW